MKLPSASKLVMRPPGGRGRGSNGPCDRARQAVGLCTGRSRARRRRSTARGRRARAESTARRSSTAGRARPRSHRGSLSVDVLGCVVGVAVRAAPFTLSPPSSVALPRPYGRLRADAGAASHRKSRRRAHRRGSPPSLPASRRPGGSREARWGGHALGAFVLARQPRLDVLAAVEHAAPDLHGPRPFAEVLPVADRGSADPETIAATSSFVRSASRRLLHADGPCRSGHVVYPSLGMSLTHRQSCDRARVLTLAFRATRLYEHEATTTADGGLRSAARQTWRSVERYVRGARRMGKTQAATAQELGVLLGRNFQPVGTDPRRAGRAATSLRLSCWLVAEVLG